MTYCGRSDVCLHDALPQVPVHHVWQRLQVQDQHVALADVVVQGETEAVW
jgi:hypothetical protein